MKRTLLLLAISSLCISAVAVAQTNDVTSPLVITLNPEYPAPNSQATARVGSIAFNLNSATIAWLHNGDLVESGVGKTTHTFTAGAPGNRLIVTAVAQTPDGTIYENSVEINPASVDLVWESRSSSMPFYKGKSLYPRFGDLKIIALPEALDPDGIQYPASELMYVWSKDDEVLGKDSGYGRSSLVVTDPLYRTPVSIGVLVSTREGVPLASNTIDVDIFDPLVVLYEDSPLYGILFNRAVQDFNLTGTEVNLQAYPLFMASTRRNLEYQWSINAIPVNDFKGPLITFRNVEAQGGRASVGLTVLNNQTFAVPGSTQFTITYGSTSQ